MDLNKKQLFRDTSPKKGVHSECYNTMIVDFPFLKIVTDKEAWGDTLKRIDSYDFYHTFDYHQLSKKNNEEALLIVYDAPSTLIALPLLIRPIEGTSYNDATSVYGYGGPVIKGIPENADFTDFHMALNAFFSVKNIVSVFTRLHPFIKNQEAILNHMGHIDELGNVVHIDLAKDLQDQRKAFSGTTKRYLNKIRKSYHTRIGNSKADILRFIELYYENMNRVNAKEDYYFSEDYFFDLMESSEFETLIIFAVNNTTKKEVSGAMMIRTNNEIIQYHLSGTMNDYLKVTPLRLLIDEIRIMGTKDCYKHFNLGGGVNSEEDSLFFFKSSFSKNFKKFKVWKYIVDLEAYYSLSQQNSTKYNYSSFFPVYRRN
ncbi:GNAT family N-acetyltransferase [Spongiimicrobium salis]|uniref:GNAT family N-acetyltransferase n=1 Tax=Spongiimicrobium salis TaxID=1667022 RepID=UPI00374CDBCD